MSVVLLDDGLGSPPRVREKQGQTVLSKLFAGITPASAGKTIPAFSFKAFSWDHPRECGKNFDLLS